MSNLTRIAEYNLRKKASAYSDTLGGIVGGLPFSALAVAAPAAAPVANVISSGVGLAGNIHGIIDKQGNPVQELAQLGADPLKSMIPGVAASRLVRRQRLVHKLVAQDPSNDQNIALHRLLANIVNPLNWVASPISGLAAAVTDGHTPEERAEVANDPNQVLKTWLIPGYGAYQTYKDLGLSNRVEDIDQVIANLKRSGKHGEAAQYELLAKAGKLKSKKKKIKKTQEIVLQVPNP